MRDSRPPRKFRRKYKFRRKHLVMAALLASPVATLLAWQGLTHLAADRTKAIVELGYVELMPPSTIYLPGTIGTVEYVADDSVRLHPTCKMDRKELDAAIERSATVDRRIIETYSRGIDATTELRDALSSSTAGEKVRGIEVSLQNMWILSMSGEALIKLQKQYIKDECEQAIHHNLRAGAEVCQVSEVLQADAVYRIDYRSELDSEQKVQASKEIAATINAAADTTTMDVMRGNGLFFGVKVKHYCIVLDNVAPEADPQQHVAVPVKHVAMRH